MKKAVVLSLFISFVLFSCAQKEVKSPIEGAWKLVYFKTGNYIFPGNLTGDQIKMWTATHFTFDGTFKSDTVENDNYGWGTYTLDGNKYVETIKFFPNKSNIGNKVNLLLEIRNDTLIQRYPADENWNLPENYRVEKYIRIE